MIRKPSWLMSSTTPQHRFRLGRELEHGAGGGQRHDVLADIQHGAGGGQPPPRPPSTGTVSMYGRLGTIRPTACPSRSTFLSLLN